MSVWIKSITLNHCDIYYPQSDALLLQSLMLPLIMINNNNNRFVISNMKSLLYLKHYLL